MKATATRRLFLAAGPAATVFASLGAAAAASAPSDDPVFAAIAECNRLEALHLEAITATDALFESGAAAEELEAVEAAQSEVCHAACARERELFATEPTTVAGAVAMLRFLADNFDDLSSAALDIAPDAIRAAVEVLERGARA